MVARAIYDMRKEQELFPGPPMAELQHNGHFMSYICVYEQS